MIGVKSPKESQLIAQQLCHDIGRAPENDSMDILPKSSAEVTGDRLFVEDVDEPEHTSQTNPVLSVLNELAILNELALKNQTLSVQLSTVPSGNFGKRKPQDLEDVQSSPAKRSKPIDPTPDIGSGNKIDVESPKATNRKLRRVTKLPRNFEVQNRAKYRAKRDVFALPEPPMAKAGVESRAALSKTTSTVVRKGNKSQIQSSRAKSKEGSQSIADVSEGDWPNDVLKPEVPSNTRALRSGATMNNTQPAEAPTTIRRRGKRHLRLSGSGEVDNGQIKGNMGEGDQQPDDDKADEDREENDCEKNDREESEHGESEEGESEHEESEHDESEHDESEHEESMHEESEHEESECEDRNQEVGNHGDSDRCTQDGIEQHYEGNALLNTSRQSPMKNFVKIELFRQDDKWATVLEGAQEVGESNVGGKRRKKKPELQTRTISEFVRVVTELRTAYTSLLRFQGLEHDSSGLEEQLIEGLDDTSERIGEIIEPEDGAEASKIIQDIFAHAFPHMVNLLKVALQCRTKEYSKPHDIDVLQEIIGLQGDVITLCEKARNWNAKPCTRRPIIRPIPPKVLRYLRDIRKAFERQLYKRQSQINQQKGIEDIGKCRKRRDEDKRRREEARMRGKEESTRRIAEDLRRDRVTLADRSKSVQFSNDNFSLDTSYLRQLPTSKDWTVEQNSELLNRLQLKELRYLPSVYRSLLLRNDH